MKGASQGAGLGNKFLENIRRTGDDDRVSTAVRTASPVSYTHLVDPLGDIETIDLELIMADLEMVNRRVEKAAKAAKGDKKFLDVYKRQRVYLKCKLSQKNYELYVKSCKIY